MIFPYSMLQHTLIWERSTFPHSFLKTNFTNILYTLFKVIIFEIGSGICLKDTCANYAQFFCIILAPPKTLCFSLELLSRQTFTFTWF